MHLGFKMHGTTSDHDHAVFTDCVDPDLDAKTALCPHIRAANEGKKRLIYIIYTYYFCIVTSH